MEDFIEATDDEVTQTPADEREQPISIRMLDRLEITALWCDSGH